MHGDHDATASGAAGLFRIVYDSVVMLPFGAIGATGLQSIVSVARARNGTLGITGVLYCDGAYFMQVLEGPRAAVLSVFTSILCDTRHREIRISSVGALARRDFSGSAMALVDEAGLRAASVSYPVMSRIATVHISGFVGTMRRALANAAAS